MRRLEEPADRGADCEAGEEALSEALGTRPQRAALGVGEAHGVGVEVSDLTLGHAVTRAHVGAFGDAVSS